MGPYPYWTDVTTTLLNRESISCDLFQPTGRLALIKWFLEGQWRRYNIIYHVGGITNWRTGLTLSMTAKPVIWHWIGSDVLSFESGEASRGWRGIINRLVAYRWAKVHIADSPEIAEELRNIGISTSIVRLLPERVDANVKPLPQKFSVLSYWSNIRKDFYGGDIVLRLARELPNVEFKILGATGDEEVSLPNVRFLGFQKNMDNIYDSSTVLIRLPKHDSLSAMVLEMLARGRYVIYNKKLIGCYFAQTFEQTKQILIQTIKLSEPNINGAEFVKQNFSVAEQARELAEICNRLVTRVVKSNPSQ